MNEKMKFYRCSICGNILGQIKNGGGNLVCCGKPMDVMVANSVDASLEKHVPYAERVDGQLKISIGTAPHPMAEEHFIEWVAVCTDKGTQRIALVPGQEPVVYVCDADPEERKTTIYAYCNLHGLWKTTI